MRPFKAVLLAVAVSVLALGTARAEVKVHPIFSDNMVLQQGAELVVWGLAYPGERITVQISRKADGVADVASVVAMSVDGGVLECRPNRLREASWKPSAQP